MNRKADAMQADDDLQSNIDRTVGFSVLRRMSRLAGDTDRPGDRAPDTAKRSDNPQQANIDRTVGFTAVRRMSKLAAEIKDLESRSRTTARRLLVATAIVLLGLVLVMTIDPGAIAGLLRRLTNAWGS